MVHYWRDNSNGNVWHRQDVISSKATGDASLIQSSYVGKPGSPANFEAVILEGKNLVHYWRDNSNGNKWNRQDVITSSATGAGALIQSTYKGNSGAPGNFEVVVLEGSNLVHYWRDNANGNKWIRQAIITSNATSPAALIQSSYKSNPGAPGNFELVVKEGSSLVHYWRDNSNGNVWHRQDVIASGDAGNGPGTLIQSSYGSPGNFELLVLEGSSLVHYWRDNSNGNVWHRQVVITNNVNGPGSLIQSSYGTPAHPGNFELIVVQNGHNLDHYWRNNSGGNDWGFTVTVSTSASG
jgi:hypothetical protein